MAKSGLKTIYNAASETAGREAVRCCNRSVELEISPYTEALVRQLGRYLPDIQVFGGSQDGHLYHECH